MTSCTTTVGALVAAALWFAPLAAWGQDGTRLDPNRQDLTVQPPPMSTARAPQVPTLTTAAAPGVALSQVIIDGPSSTADIAAVWRPYVGRPLGAETLRAIADGVAKVYGRTAALYTVTLPNQDFTGGVVRLRVTEGHFETVVIHGAVKDRDMRLIRAYAARMAAETPLTRRTLERYVSLIRDIPGLKPDIQLLQGQTPGGVRLAIGVTEQRFSWGLGVDNRGSPLLDQQEVQADAVWNSLLRQGDQTRVTVASSADFRSAQAVSVTQSEPIGADGMRWDLSAAWLQTRAVGLGLRGRAVTLSSQISYPLIRSYKDNLYLTAGLDGLDSDNAIFGQTLASEHTRSLRAGAVFSRSRPQSAFSLSATASLGVDGLGARVNPALADADYGKLMVRAGYDRKLGKAVTLRLRGAAQAAGDSLLPTSEMFALGGDPYGRGFTSGLLLGDSGTAGSAELGWAPQGLPAAVAGSELYGFTDAGDIKLNARAGVSGHDSLSSAGAGVRLAFKPGYVLGLEAAYPIDRPATVARDWRYGFSLRSRF